MAVANWIVMTKDLRLHIVYDQNTEEDAIRVFEEIRGEKAIAIARYTLGKTIKMKKVENKGA